MMRDWFRDIFFDNNNNKFLLKTAEIRFRSISHREISVRLLGYLSASYSRLMTSNYSDYLHYVTYLQ